MSIFKWPFTRIQYPGIDNPRFVSDIVALSQGIIDAAIAMSGLGSTDFAILSGFDYTGPTPSGTYAPGIFYLNGSIYSIGTTTNEGLYLISGLIPTESQPFTDGNSRNIYQLNQGSTSTSPAGASPVLSGNMNAYRISAKQLNINIQSILATIATLGTAAFLNIGTTTGTVADGGASYSKTASDLKYLLLSGGTLTGPLILAADPTINLGSATKQYADAASGMKMLWIGNISGDGATITPLGTTYTLTITVVHVATGHYTITHNIGNTNYYVNGIGINNGTGTTAYNNVASVLNITNDSFDVILGDTVNHFDSNFQLAIMKYF